MSKYARHYWHRPDLSSDIEQVKADIDGSYIVSSAAAHGRVDEWDGYSLHLDSNSADELRKKLERAKDEYRKFSNRIGFLKAAIEVREAWDADEAERQREADEKAKQEAERERLRTLAGDLQSVYHHGAPGHLGYYGYSGISIGGGGGIGGWPSTGSWDRLARWIDEKYGDK